MKTIFDIRSDEAYVRQGVLKAGQRWYSFDRRIAEARQGLATKFAMTLWNVSVCRDTTTGSYWYKIPYVWGGETSANRKGLCEALLIASKQGIPMVGILKNHDKPHRCSSRHLFTIVKVVEGVDPTATWIKIEPSDPEDIGCTVTLDAIPVENHSAPQLADIEREFSLAVQKSKSDRSERLKRLLGAGKIPEKITVTTTVYRRNPDVVAEVLDRAGGKCGYCNQRAPFVRSSTGEPYLEVHHVQRLADGGEDSVENAIAACPNCHREKHYGLTT
ncbi:HNH endonuclease signature motif containing protein [Xylophilus sp. GOD-11R]|uniref:HNH endonuclease n=1 Tax=Xylophilus sp. GOD-11R TaxID=3089814 RepID=UPI00298D0149|nr:HNH endonuclease signature motif containing protein [Xylophilus sp. GOD-11R]WPB58734.1 HNH endonuclease signature motif containing protein [Xylophilus sp. GOD-11R]